MPPSTDPDLNEGQTNQDPLIKRTGKYLPLTEIVQRAFDGFVFIDENQIIKGFSDNISKFFQYTPEELLGHPLDMLIPLPSIEIHRQHVIEFLSGQELSRPMHGKLRVIYCRRKDGSIFPAEATIFKGHNPSADNGYLLGMFFRDVSERVKQEEQIRAAAQFNQAVLDSQSVHICVLDATGSIMAVNKAWFEFAAANGAEMAAVSIGANYLEVTDGAIGEDTVEISAIAAGIRGVLSGTQSYFTTTYPCHSPDQKRWFTLHVTPIDTIGDSRAVIVHENITQRKLAEESFWQAQKLESLGMFAMGIAHDFNNVLTAIISRASLGEHKHTHNKSIAAEFNNIVYIAEQAVTITQQLMTFAGENHESPQLIDLNETIQKTIPLLYLAIPKFIKLDIELTTQQTPIWATTGQIQQIVMNLVINSAEAHEGKPGVITLQTNVKKSGEANDINLELEIEEPYIWLRVTDSGKGMDVATKNRVFDPFFTTKPTGHGLGLAALQGIVRNLNGVIGLESELGLGTTFHILLPYGVSRDASKQAENALPLILVPEQTKQILLVDDETTVRETIAEYLQLSDFEVLTAANGASAINLFEKYKGNVDLAILDMNMPGLSGVDVYAHINQTRPELPVIFLSGSYQKPVPAWPENYVFYLKKPFRLKVLLQKIKEVVSNCN